MLVDTKSVPRDAIFSPWTALDIAELKLMFHTCFVSLDTVFSKLYNQVNVKRLNFYEFIMACYVKGIALLRG
jgi:hypothetical protein